MKSFINSVSLSLLLSLYPLPTHSHHHHHHHHHPPIIVNTWSGPFFTTTNTAFTTLLSTSSALTAVAAGAAACESAACDRTVGFGGSPDENCETTLDALIMDGTTMNAGAVAGLKRVKNAVGVARMVMERTGHTLLVGEAATEFAVKMGFVEEDLGTEESRGVCETWKQAKCQPNFWTGVLPDSRSSCGPYSPSDVDHSGQVKTQSTSHDTVSVLALASDSTMAAATSTNGARHKIPGRVGDGPIVGSGSYVDGDVGACGATGDGDIMMRFLPCYQAVENLRRGMSAHEAAEDSVRRMLNKFPDIQAGLVVLSKEGEIGAAGSNWGFEYSWRAGDMTEAQKVVVEPLTALGRDEL